MYSKGRVLSGFQALGSNVYKRDKPLEAWSIEDNSELVCELMPTFHSSTSSVSFVKGPEGTLERQITTTFGVNHAAGKLDLARLELHRRKNSLSVVLFASPSVVATVAETKQNANAEILKAEQSLQLSIGIKMRALLQDVIRRFGLRSRGPNGPAELPEAYRLRQVSASDLLGSPLSESGQLCQPSDVVHSNDSFTLEVGHPLKDGEMSLRVGLILGNDRSNRGGGGKLTPQVEVIVPGTISIAELKVMVLRATWHLNEPKSTEPGKSVARCRSRMVRAATVLINVLCCAC